MKSWTLNVNGTGSVSYLSVCSYACRSSESVTSNETFSYDGNATSTFVARPTAVGRGCVNGVESGIPPLLALHESLCVHGSRSCALWTVHVYRLDVTCPETCCDSDLCAVCRLPCLT